MADISSELLDHIKAIRKLLELLAEPAIAKRDTTLREGLRRIVGRSPLKRQAVLLMTGKLRQRDIQAESGINKGGLSTLVSRLSESALLAGDPKYPTLAISIPSDFFEEHE